MSYSAWSLNRQMIVCHDLNAYSAYHQSSGMLFLNLHAIMTSRSSFSQTSYSILCYTSIINACAELDNDGFRASELFVQWAVTLAGAIGTLVFLIFLRVIFLFVSGHFNLQNTKSY